MTAAERQFLIAVAGLAMMVPGLASSQQGSPAEWLDKMTSAVASANYEGTIIRSRQERSEALKVVHTIVDGVINERVTSQEGNGLEIIRVGNEVHCILPDKKSVLVEGWNNQSTLFSPLPQRAVLDTPHYNLSVAREGRIAGRPAVQLAVRPHDDYRYAHRIWLDKASGFPLRTEVRNIDGELIEEVKFADIRFSESIDQAALKPSIDLHGFTWYREPTRSVASIPESDWYSDDLPAGFRMVSVQTEATDQDGDTTQIIYSDGVANVSVFISTLNEDVDSTDGWTILGASNSYNVRLDDVMITAVGEVPGITVQRIATSMRSR